MALFMTLTGFDQTGRQVAQQTLGSYDYSADLGGLFPLRPGEGSTPATSGLAAAGAVQSTTILQTFDVRADAAPALFTVYLEGEWTGDPFPDRYILASGRWPSQPGEVAASAAYLRAVGATGLPAVTTVLSGNTDLTVVGEVHDRFSTDSARLLAAPGTWANLDKERLAKGFPSLSVSPTVLWNGGDPIRVAASIIGLYAGDDQGRARPVLSLSSREGLLTRDRKSYTEDIPLAYTVPSLALPFGAVLFAYGLNGRRLRRNLATLRAVGISNRAATIGVGLATSFWLLVAAVTGSLIGVAVGLIARAVAAQYLTRPLAPVDGILTTGVRTVATVLLTSGIVVLLSARSRRTTTVMQELHRSPAPRRRGSPLRRTALAVLTLALALQASSLTTIPDAMLLTLTCPAVVLLVMRDAIPMIVRTLPDHGPRSRLVRRQLLADDTRVHTAAGVITAVFATALSMVVLLEALTVSEAENRVTAAAPGQVNLIAGGGGLESPPTPDLVDTVEAALPPGAASIDVGFVIRPTRLAASKMSSPASCSWSTPCPRWAS
jgi:hypothetical protein